MAIPAATNPGVDGGGVLDSSASAATTTCPTTAEDDEESSSSIGRRCHDPKSEADKNADVHIRVGDYTSSQHRPLCDDDDSDPDLDPDLDPDPDFDRFPPTARRRTGGAQEFAADEIDFSWSSWRHRLRRWAGVLGGTRRCPDRPADAGDGYGARGSPRNDTANISTLWSRFTRRFRWHIVVFWIIVIWPAGLYCFPKFTRSTSSLFRPLPGTPSYEADLIYKGAYRISEKEHLPVVVLLTQRNGTSVGGGVVSSNDTMIDGRSALYERTRDYVLNMTSYLEDLAGSFRRGDEDGASGDTSLMQTALPVPDDENFNSSSSLMDVDGGDDGAGGGGDSYASISSFYALERDGLSKLARHSFASSDGRMTFVRIQFATPNEADKRTFLDAVTTYATRHVPTDFGVDVEFTGLHFFQEDMLVGVRTDVEVIDRIVLPLALLVLAVVLGNLPIMVIPLLTIATTILLSGVVMYPVALAIQVTQFTPTLMMSLVVAMGVDYSLFLLSRCIEDVGGAHYGMERKGEAIRSMLEHSGHTIVVSGLTLCCCFLGLLLLPLPMLASVGIGASVAILSALAVNLSLTPALLHTTVLGDRFLRPNAFFSRLCCTEPGSPGRGARRRRVGDKGPDGRSVEDGSSDEDVGEDGIIVGVDDGGTGRRSATGEGRDETIAGENGCDSPAVMRADDDGPGQLAAPLLGGEGTSVVRVDNEEWEIVQNEHVLDDDIDEIRGSMWYRLGRTLLHPVKGPIILLLVVGVMAPVAYFAPQCGSSISFDLMMPAGSPSQRAFDELGSKFGMGALSPYKIVFDGRPAGARIDTFEAHEAIHHVLGQLSDARDFPATPNLSSFTSIATMGGRNISYWEYEAAMLCGPRCPLEGLRTVAALAGGELNAPADADGRRTTTYANAILNVDPYSKEGTEWLSNARRRIDELNGSGNVANLHLSLYGGASIEYDAVHTVFRHFPRMIFVTLSIVFILMGLFFRSVVVPLRSVLSIGLTLAFVFGLAVLVYQHGLLDFVGIRSLAYSGSISWLPPVMSFSIIVGLGLDYDVFLISRVLEYRMEGCTDDSAVLKGMHKTGGIITAAGIIMAVAFGGLLTSATLVLNQIAFMLTCAVVVDTFVIRTVVVPILLGITGRFSWWPRKLPPETLDVLQL